MEHRLIQTQSQKLILSPQMRQYLKLLQLPLLQLKNEIEQELTENPALEEVSRDAMDDGQTASAAEAETKKEDGDNQELRFEATMNSLDRMDENFKEASFSDQDLSVTNESEAQKHKNFRESLITPKESLSDFLIWQIGFLNLTEIERKISEEIIGNLTEDGYLRTPLEEIAQSCGVEPSEAEKVLRMIQDLDPPGIAARNLQETLLIQLRKSASESGLAQKIVEECFLLLEKKQLNQIAKKLKANPGDVQQASKLIARLDPRPGRTFYGEETKAVSPDAAVYLDDSEEHKLMLDVFDDELPELRLNPYYRRLLRDPNLDAASRRFLKEKIQSAMEFLKALGQRRSTLRNITQEIVNVQSEFFEKGFSHIKPLRLKDISARLGIHESTVSRAIQEKYLSTPFGTLPYKSFFSSRLETAEGGAESQKSLMEKIRKLIHEENPEKPLSDQGLVQILQNEGIKIARRTVAKYRELLKILPSHLRRKR